MAPELGELLVEGVGEGDVAEVEGGREQDAAFVAEDELGGAAADVDGEHAAVEDGEELEEAEVDKAGLVAAREDLDVEP